MNLNFTMIGQTLTFIVFVWACWKWIWPMLIDAMRERQEAIAEGLAAAERAAKDLELAQERATDQLKDAKEEAAGLIGVPHPPVADQEQPPDHRRREPSSDAQAPFPSRRSHRPAGDPSSARADRLSQRTTTPAPVQAPGEIA